MGASSDIAVIGGGLVGTAIALGLLRSGAHVALYDPLEDDFHASAGNFGLVWVQGKGLDAPHYAALTRRSAARWDAFADEIAEKGGTDPHYRRCGGAKIALDEEEFAALRATSLRMHNRQPDEAANAKVDLIDGATLRSRVPHVSAEAVGALWCDEDGHADPLATLTALRRTLIHHPRVRIVRARVDSLCADGNGFRFESSGASETAGKVVVAAGLGAAGLGETVGLHAPVRPQRGQILVTERMPPFLDVACHTVRQTGQGTVLMGDSKEDVGFDRGTLPSVGAAMARRAARMFPILKTARVVRQWGALRVMSPDGVPVYAQSESHPGAMLVTCHSGVTLAAAHAGEVADAIVAGTLGRDYRAFSPDRFAKEGANA
ncbi:MAG: FAD-dependent oxidoreductase [Pseudomonadota bacterium]